MVKYLHLFMIVFLIAACIPAASMPNTSTPSVTQPAANTPAPQRKQPEPSLGTNPKDANSIRGDVFLEEASLVIRESYPPQIALVLKGDLPTPCHQLRIHINPPDEENQIFVDVYSNVGIDTVCIQVIKPFEENINIGTFPVGHYTVLVNGEKVGEFDS